MTFLKLSIKLGWVWAWVGDVSSESVTPKTHAMNGRRMNKGLTFVVE